MLDVLDGETLYEGGFLVSLGFDLQRGDTLRRGSRRVPNPLDASEQRSRTTLAIQYGLRHDLQLGLAIPFVSQDRDGAGIGADSAGVGDVMLLGKWRFYRWDAPGKALNVSALAELSLPTGDGAASSGDVDPSLGFFWSPAAQPALFFGHVVSRADDEIRFGNSVGIGASLTEGVSAYVEYFGTVDDDRSDHNANAGIAWTPTPEIQFDFYAGVGLDSDAADGFVGFGFARRF